MTSNLRTIAQRLLQTEYKNISTDPSSIFSVGLENDDWFTWRVLFQGPNNTLYSGGIFTAHLEFPEDYPNNPPKMIFQQEMWHPNIYPDGRVCISSLHAPGTDEFNEMETAEERWRPILGVESVLISVISMLSDPNLESPANIEAAKHMREQPEEYRRKVRRLAQNTNN
eukprot:Selendium_serpulae@DN4477_c0_g1_i1.p1